MHTAKATHKHEGHTKSPEVYGVMCEESRLMLQTETRAEKEMESDRRTQILA